MQAASFSATAFAAFIEFAVPVPDYDKLKEVANSIVPFGRLAGVRVTELTPDRAVAELPGTAEVTNHVGTVHAAAMYLAADFAGAVAFVGAAPADVGQVEWIVVRGGHSTFLKPATGRIRAVGTVDQRDVRAITGRSGAGKFDLDGKAMLYDDDDVLVAKFSFDYVCLIAAPDAA
jgi:acyl-coenzyme A thioesterase PaaI-like protein